MNELVILESKTLEEQKNKITMIKQYDVIIPNTLDELNNLKNNKDFFGSILLYDAINLFKLKNNNKHPNTKELIDFINIELHREIEASINKLKNLYEI